MYEAMGGQGDSGEDSSKKVRELPLEAPTDYNQITFGSNPVSQAPKMAVLSPSAMLQKSSPTLQIRSKELSPTTDTGKDTQQLVCEEDNSEC